MNTTACVLALALCGPVASVMASEKGQATTLEQVDAKPMTLAQAAVAPSTSLTAAQATKAAQQLLDALQAKDAAELYAGLSAPCAAPAVKQQFKTD